MKKFAGAYFMEAYKDDLIGLGNGNQDSDGIITYRAPISVFITIVKSFILISINKGRPILARG